MDSLKQLDPRIFDVPSPQIAKTRDGHPGYTAEMEAEDTTDAIRSVCMGIDRSCPAALIKDPNDWEEIARENDRERTWPTNYADHYTNQDPTHECTCHSLIQNATIARNRQRAIKFKDGPKKGFRYQESQKSGSVFLSPLSVYAEANPGQWGGANVRQVMEIACKRGILPDNMQPASYNFRHTLHGTTGKGNNNQSKGPWVRLKDFPEGWQNTARWFKPLEVIFPASWEEAVCLVLAGYAVSVGRNGHAVPWTRFLPGQGMEYIDSYDVLRYDSLNTVKRAWSGAFAIATMTVPDDWNKPAGE